MSYKFAVVCANCVRMVAVEAVSEEHAETKVKKFIEEQCYQYDGFYLVTTHVVH